MSTSSQPSGAPEPHLSSAGRLPVVVLAGMTRPDTAVVEGALAFSLPGTAVLRHEIDLTRGVLTRCLSDHGGVVERVEIPLEHACLTCALRYEIVPMLLRLKDAGQHESVVVSLPLAADPAPVVRGIRDMVIGSRRAVAHLEVARVVVALDGQAVVDDVFGDDLLRERDEEGFPGDARAWGEALAAQLEYADVLALADGSTSEEAAALLDALRRPGSRVVPEVSTLVPADLLGGRRDHRAAEQWVHPLTRSAGPTGLPGDDAPSDAVAAFAPAEGIWSVVLDTWRPFHPGRLMRDLEHLGGGGLRGRGCFWLPTRPGGVGVWDGSGGQLSIGTSGTWEGRRPRTRVVVTGRGEGQQQVAAALRGALLTDAELAGGLGGWVGLDDEFDPWLGRYSDIA
ncbi:GTP-binding protein [Pedococcus aerophilus]|uniref:GTP-binding protein n=1 Tax=Pedococcus aerophilus TaxID=436356 RepID=A0ABN3UTA3_9MICO